MKVIRQNILVFILISLICFNGCISSSGKYLTKFCISNQNKTSFSMSYDSFDGYKVYSVKFEENSVIKIDFTTESGQLDCKIEDNAGNILYQKENTETLQDTLTIENNGKYKITLTAENHKGSFSFDWTK